MEFTVSTQLTRLVLVLSVVLFCSVTDINARRIPNAVLVPALFTALFLNTVDAGLAGITDSVGGLLIGIGMLLPLYILGRMGAGDVKLLGVVGSIIGAWGAVVAGLATMVAGGVLGIGYLLWFLARPSFRTPVRRMSSLMKGVPINITSASGDEPQRPAEIPYAVAIAAGTVLAVTYLGLASEVIRS